MGRHARPAKSLRQIKARVGGAHHARGGGRLLKTPTESRRERSSAEDVGRRDVWTERAPVLQKLVEANDLAAQNLLEGWKQSLLAEVLDRLGHKTKIAASVMNTTEQTLRKWRKEVM